MNPERREALLGVKLRALATTLPGWDGGAVACRFPAGAALRTGTTGFLLVDEAHVERDPTEPAHSRESPRGWLGGAVIWAIRNRAQDVHLLLDVVDGADARRATLFHPKLHLWRIDGRILTAVDPSPPFVEVPAPPIDVLAFAGIIEAAGAEAVVEHGELRAEVLGLEVGRVLVHPELGPVLEVGVGRHDRLATEMLHQGANSEEVLRRAVEAVRALRIGMGSTKWMLHPANQLQRERWLRTIVCGHSELAGLPADLALRPVCATRQTALKRPGPAIALGPGVVVACTVGVDLDAVPDAADARLAYGPDASLVICVPDGDDHPALRDLVGALVHPATLRTVTSDWRDLSVS